MAQILTFTQYLTYVYTTDKSQSTKYDRIYDDIEQTYVRNLLTTPTFDKVIAGTYTINNRASMFALLKKCIAKRIEIEYINIGGAENTALGLVTRENQFSNQADRAAVDRRLSSIKAILNEYENQLIVILQVIANFPEYVTNSNPLSTDCPYDFISVGDTVTSHSEYPFNCTCDTDCDYCN